MKQERLMVRVSGWVAIAGLAVSSVSCMTTYDGYGRPVQSVDPGLAVAGIAAAGLIGYAAANDHGRDRYRGDDCYGGPRVSSSYVSTRYTSVGGCYGGGGFVDDFGCYDGW